MTNVFEERNEYRKKLQKRFLTHLFSASGRGIVQIFQIIYRFNDAPYMEENMIRLAKGTYLVIFLIEDP